MIKAIPILTYHHVTPLTDDLVTVSLDHFQRQMAFLKDRGYETLFISEVVEWMKGLRSVSDRAVAITFDDGYLDNLRFAFPVLEGHRLKATIFVTTGWPAGEREDPGDSRVYSHQECRDLVARGRASRISLTWAEMAGMEQSGLIFMESHTHQHQKNLYLDKEALEEDLHRSQETFWTRLKRKSTCLCWPGGRYNEQSIAVAQKAGFLSLCTTERGINQPGTDPFRLKRITVKDADDRWLKKTLFLFSRPAWGKFYAKIKPK